MNRLALADAQTLAIRKLMSKSAFDSTLSPGPPLPRSHPAPALIAKLYLHNASLYDSARSLAKTPGSKAATSHLDGGGGEGTDGGEVSSDLRKYLGRNVAFSNALAHKWLGVDAGEHERVGEAVAYLSWAKEELVTGRESRAKAAASLGKSKGNEMGSKREKVAEEIDRVQAFLGNYKRQNDMVSDDFSYGPFVRFTQIILCFFRSTSSLSFPCRNCNLEFPPV